MGKPRHMIACEVLRPEVELLLSGLDGDFRISWLEQGLHNTPEILRREVQRQIRCHEAAGAEHILLGYGLCGRGLSGVSGEKATLALPKTHDCIPLLLGVEQAEAQKLSKGGRTLWMSPGWNKCELGPRLASEARRYAEYAREYGMEGADYIREAEQALFKNYVQASLIRWEGCWDDMDALVRQSRAIAGSKNLPYAECPGASGFLRALLDGGRTASFLQLRPGMTADLDAGGNLVAIPVGLC